MSKLIFESEYRKDPIRFNFLAIFIMLSISLPFMIIGSVAMMKSSLDQGEHRGSMMTLVAGLKHLTKSDFIGSAIAFVLIYFLIYYAITRYVNKRLIVVKIEFDDTTQQVSVYRIKHNDKLIQLNFNQNELLYRTAKEESDGVSAKKFRCIKLIYEEELVGRIFLDHFTWTKSLNTDNMIVELKERIKQTKKYY